MGLFGRKKNNDSQISTLSENEIQKKLYGEFKKDPSRIAGSGERGSAVEFHSAASKARSGEIAPDLFNAPKETVETTHLDFPSAPRETSKFSEPVSKTSVPAENRYQVAPSKPAADPYQRYREINMTASKGPGFSRGIFSIGSRAATFFTDVFGSDKFFSRKILYWTTSVLVVFLLFWGVNTLNVQREQSMKSQYQTPAKGPLKIIMPADGKGDSSATASRSSGVVAEETAVSIPKSQAALPAVPSGEASTAKPASAGAKYGGRFVIQVVTYPTADYAERVVTSLKQAGFKAFMKENVRPTGTTFYLVLIGGFRTAAEAQQQLAKFRTSEISRPFSDAFLKTIE